MNVQNKTILITGANRGIGKAYAEEFLKAGATKIYLGVRNTSSVSDLVASNPDTYVALKLDVTSSSDIEAAAETAKDVEILINNAGILHKDDFGTKENVEHARQQMEVNYIAPLALTQAFAPILKANGGGVLVTVSSIAGHVAFPELITYSASKFAAHALILGARQSLQAQGTQVIGVYPGPIDTDMGNAVDMEKFSPNVVATETIAAIENGTDDVFPDPFAQELYNAYRADAKTVELQMIDMANEEQEAA